MRMQLNTWVQRCTDAPRAAHNCMNSELYVPAGAAAAGYRRCMHVRMCIRQAEDEA